MYLGYGSNKCYSEDKLGFGYCQKNKCKFLCFKLEVSHMARRSGT